MKERKKASKTPSTLLEERIKSKRDDAVKTRLNLLKPQIVSYYREYQSRFSSATLHQLSSQPWSDQEKKDLQGLYDKGCRPIIDLFNELTTDDKGQSNIECPYCQIGPSTTLDHIVPKEEKPAFSIHPWNLIPCCSACNSHKSQNWKEPNELKYINYYQDKLPTFQYLMCQVYLKNKAVLAMFWLDSSALSGHPMGDKILRHYKDLKLCKRFSKSFGDEIGLLGAEIKSSTRMGVPDGQIKTSIIYTAKAFQTIRGVNYWKAIFYLAVAVNDIVFQFLKTS